MLSVHGQGTDMSGTPDGDELAVGYVLHRFPVLSQTFVTNEIDELRRRGRRVVVVALERGDAPIDTEGDVLIAADTWELGTLNFRMRHAASRVTWATRAPTQFRRRMQFQTRFDDSRFRPWLVPLIASHLHRQRVGWLHTHFAWGGAAHALAVGDLMELPVSMTVHAKDIFVPKRDLAAKLAATNHLVSVCEYNDSWMADHQMIRPPTTRVICGVRTVPAPTAPPTHDLVVVGRLVAKKGIDVTLRAFERLLKRTPELRLTVVGDGEERRALEDLAVALSIHGNVTFLGALPHEQTLDVIAGARVLVLSTRIAPDGDRDSMPVVVKEAMMRQVPVVGTEVVAMPEMIDGSVGRLVPPEDPMALADAIADVLADEERRRAMGIAARQRAIEQFSLEANVERLDQIWAATLAGRR